MQITEDDTAAFQELLHSKNFVRLVDMKDNEDGQTALHWAVRINDLDLVELLLYEGHANPNIPDNRGRTALHWAARVGSPEIIEVLIGAGASINATVCRPLPLSSLPLLHQAIKQRKTDQKGETKGGKRKHSLDGDVRVRESKGDDRIVCWRGRYQHEKQLRLHSGAFVLSQPQIQESDDPSRRSTHPKSSRYLHP